MLGKHAAPESFCNECMKTAALQFKVKKIMGLSELIIPQLNVSSAQVTCTKNVG